MIEISLCMIVKNEEATLPRCLESVGSIADEIIVVDTGSKDGTVAAARECGAAVYAFDWCDDFSAARNYAFSKAVKPYILWLDADDVIEESDAARFMALKASLPLDVDYVYCPYHAGFCAAGKPNFTFYRERIVKNDARARWLDPVHECIAPFGRTYFSDAAVSHRKPPSAGYSRRNLNIYEAHKKAGKPMSARMQYYYARELAAHGHNRRAVAAFRAFLKRPERAAVNAIDAHIQLSHCLCALKKEDEAIGALTAALTVGAPDAALCSALGDLFLKRNSLLAAAFWYESALRAPPPDRLSFVSTELSGFYPALSLCVVYYRLGNIPRAAEYNDLAGTFRPDDSRVAYNRHFFKGENG